MLLGLLLSEGAANGEPASTEQRPDSGALGRSIVVSGGVSLGAYQAGFLYLYTEVLKQGAVPVPLMTGASAGSANAFLAGISMCRGPVLDPHESLAWKTWIPVGFDRLHDPEQVRRDGLFTRRPVLRATEMIWNELVRGLPDTCDFVLGVTTTRLQIHQVQLQQGLRIPRQEEKFAVRVRGRGPGQPPEFLNYVDPYGDVEQPVLPFEEGRSLGEARRNFERFRTLIFASMAFPLAFPPQWISYCLTDPPDGQSYVPYRKLECPEPKRSDLFVDGGVLDNSPLRLAVEIAQSGLRTDGLGRPVWRDLSISGWTDRRARYSELQYMYLDPSLTVYPLEEPVTEMSKAGDAVYVAGTLFTNFIAAARSKELYTLAEDKAQLTELMEISYRYYPSAGDPLYAFMGFFERDFRVYDFFLGMYDAYRFLDIGLEDLPVEMKREEVRGSWKPFACLLGWLEEGEPSLRSACEGDELRNFRILLQTSLDRLWDQCRRHDDVPLLAPHESCKSAAQGEPPPFILGGERPEDRGRGSGEWHFNYAMRRLEAYGFEFRDLGLSRTEAQRGEAKIRSRLLAALEDFASAQSGSLNQTLLESGGRVLANQLAYELPPIQLGLLIGTTFDSVLLWAPFERWRSWFRTQAAISLDGWTSPFAPGPDFLAAGFLVGPELVIPPLTGSLFQLSVGVRGGYQLSTEDAGGTRPCRPRADQEDPRRCSQAVLQPFVAVGALDRLRLAVGLDIFPEDFGDVTAADGTRFNDARVGLEFAMGILFF